MATDHLPKGRKDDKLTGRRYLRQLGALQEELVKLQYWVKEQDLKDADP